MVITGHVSVAGMDVSALHHTTIFLVSAVRLDFTAYSLSQEGRVRMERVLAQHLLGLQGPQDLWRRLRLTARYPREEDV